ncbi:hypothetical protein BH11PSE4_BH11PSE4_20670 [soil metagenome]
MLAQHVKVSEIIDESSAQSYLNQAIMTTFCRVLDTSRLSPVTVLRMIATALGATYCDVAAAHHDGQCPCGWCPVQVLDVESLRSSLADAAAPKRVDDLLAMVVAGRA